MSESYQDMHNVGRCLFLRCAWYVRICFETAKCSIASFALLKLLESSLY